VSRDSKYYGPVPLGPASFLLKSKKKIKIFLLGYDIWPFFVIFLLCSSSGMADITVTVHIACNVSKAASSLLPFLQFLSSKQKLSLADLAE
jgi:hypothetical protein